jgi:serine/threonine-protein kinase
MAVVWLSRVLGPGEGRLVVVKMLLPQYAMDEQFQQMFVDEARISSGIAHPNVARILDAGENTATPYLVMEYIDGESIARLTEQVKKAGVKFPAGIALRLIADAAAGLHAAHELRDRDGVLLNVVHRDVSPQNVLVRNVGTAAVIDFGIAKARDRLAEETRAGNLKGKVRYMAPEQALGKPVDRRVDVWALGAMLYEIFAGKGPYEGGSEIAALQRLVKGQKPADLPANVPDAVRRVVSRALSPNRDERFATAADLEGALVDAMHELGEVPHPEDVARFAAPYMHERSAARYQAAQDAVTQIDGQSGRPRSALQATASGGYMAVTPEMADDATQVNLHYDPSSLEDPREDPRTVALASGGFSMPISAYPLTPPPPPPSDPSASAGTSVPHAPVAPSFAAFGNVRAGTTSSVPPSNIAASISEVLGSGNLGGFGPTGTQPPPPPSGFDFGASSELDGRGSFSANAPAPSGPGLLAQGSGFGQGAAPSFGPSSQGPAYPSLGPGAAANGTDQANRKLKILVAVMLVVFLATLGLAAAFYFEKI